MIIKSYIAEQDKKIFTNKFLLIYGENIGLIEDFKKKIKSIYSDSEVNNFNQANIIQNEEMFYSQIFNISLFQKQKIFLINQCNDKILEIVQNIEEKISDQKFFLFADILEKKSKLRTFFDKSKIYGSLPCYEDNIASLTKIIQKKLDGFNGLNNEIIKLLINNCNLDRSKLNNELDKIDSFFINKNLNLDDVSKILNLEENDKFNDLKDASISGDKLKTNKLLNNNYLQEEKNILYINLINQRLNKLKEIIILSKRSSLEEAINFIKPPIFWKDKPIISSQLRKWNIKKINSALKQIYDLELILKSRTGINKNVLIKKTLIDFCDLAIAA